MDEYRNQRPEENQTQVQQDMTPPKQLQSPPPEYADQQFRRYEQRKKRSHMQAAQTYRKGAFFLHLAKWIAAATVIGIVAGATIQGHYYLQTHRNKSKIAGNTVISSETQQEAQEYTQVSDIVKNAMPAIVAITNVSEVEVPFWFGQTTREQTGAGSGIIVSQDNEAIYIATNNHVVANAKSLSICFQDDETVPAEVKGVDAGWDLAVVSVKLRDIPKKTKKRICVATLGDSSVLQVGEPAIAIGNALGYGQSVTRGNISALEREVDMSDESRGKTLKNYLIQIDCAINPGNSGGALLNSKGEVIGINSAKYSDEAVEGMGYAIAMKDAQPVIDDLITRKLVSDSQSAQMGVTGLDVTEEVANAYHKPEGIYISQIEKGSAAEKAGLVVGDIITQFDGHKITSMEDLQELMRYYAAGRTVKVVAEVSNNGAYEEKTFEVVLDAKSRTKQQKR